MKTETMDEAKLYSLAKIFHEKFIRSYGNGEPEIPYVKTFDELNILEREAIVDGIKAVVEEI